MEPPKHIKTMRSVSSPPGMPPLSSHPSEQRNKTPSSAKTSQSNELNPNLTSKDCRRRHTSVLVPSSSYISEFSSSPVSPAPTDPKQDDLSLVFFSTLLKKAISTLENLSATVKENGRILRMLVQDGTPKHPKLDCLPLETIEALTQFDSKITEDVEFAKCVKILGLTGGKDEKDVIRKLLSKMLTHSLSLQLSWTETEKKSAFQKFKNIIHLIAVSVRQEKKYALVTQAVVEDTIKRWLRNASDREGGRVRRKKLPKANDILS